MSLNNEELIKRIKNLENELSSLKLQIEQLSTNSDKKIEEEIAKATFHQFNSMQHRIDQFIFDSQVQLSSRLFLNKDLNNK